MRNALAKFIPVITGAIETISIPQLKSITPTIPEQRTRKARN